MKYEFQTIFVNLTTERKLAIYGSHGPIAIIGASNLMLGIDCFHCLTNLRGDPNMTEMMLEFMLGPLRAISAFYFDYQLIFNTIIISFALFNIGKLRKTNT
uniref:ORF19 n=1 Tax=Halalkalibacterium halodurans TaxID=86665 RepID=Q9Z9U0_ALKHA|nr:unnamed protein product [Halalkalibacterium halodurans]